MAILEFLALPSELRNKIYSFCTPLDGYVEDFQGLARASRQIRAEYESEAVRVMRVYTCGVEKQGTHIKFHKIDSFRNMTEMEVALPISLYYPSWTNVSSLNNVALDAYQVDNTRMEQCFAPLFSLYLSRLTFTFYMNKENNHFAAGRVLTAIPRGFMLDLTNALVRPSCLESLEDSEPRSIREFRLHRPVRIRELAYKWVRHAINTAETYHVDMANIQFFLNEEKWFQEPNGLVTNWGYSANMVVYLCIG